MFAAGPGLTRLISDCTQPNAALGCSLAPLHKYLNDALTTDAVYQALISRAWTQPQRWGRAAPDLAWKQPSCGSPSSAVPHAA